MELAEYRRMAKVEDTHWWYRSTRQLLQELLDDELPDDGRYLDVGAGTGATGAWLSTRGRLVAADFESMALALHRERHPASTVVICEATTLPFSDAAFDVVLCVTVLCHRSIASPETAVAEMGRVVRPGGLLCLWEPGVRRVERAHDRVTHTGRRFSRRDLTHLLTINGFRIERATGAYSFLVLPAMAKALVERGETLSDLDRHHNGLRGVLPAAASAERRVLKHFDLPAGLSVVAIGRRS